MTLRKKLILVIGIPVALIGGCVILIMLHVFEWYRYDTITGNEPALKKGQLFFASCLKTPKHGDIVCYRQYPFRPNVDMNDVHVWCHRLVARHGDVVEMRNGLLYINDTLADDSTKLCFAFLASARDARTLLSKKLISKDDTLFGNGDSTFVLLDLQRKTECEKIVLLRRTRDIRYRVNPDVSAAFPNTQWNLDWFGPLLIPKGKIFLLGDNRYNALDSRYTGLANEEDIVSTVLWH